MGGWYGADKANAKASWPTEALSVPVALRKIMIDMLHYVLGVIHHW
jgi:hypothetical protein